MMLAAGKGNLDVVKSLFEEYGDDRAVDIFSQGKKERGQESTTGSSFAMNAAASNGHLAVVQYLHELEISTNKSKKRKRGKAGMMEEVKCFDTPICTKRAMDDAAASGHQAILQWLHRNRTEGCTSLGWDMAAADGHLEVLKWLHGHRPGNCTHVAWDIAAARGHLGVLKWLHEHQLGNCTTTAMDRAAQAGKLDVVQWLHANTSAGCTTKAMDGAAGNRHLDVAKWLHAHRTEGCTAYAIDMASNQGDLAIVKWLHFNRTKGYALQALNTAVLGGHLDVVNWLLTHPVAVNVGSLLRNAALLDRFEVFLLLHDACKARCTEDVAANAYKRDNSNVLQWIYGHYPALEAAVANHTHQF